MDVYKCLQIGENACASLLTQRMMGGTHFARTKSRRYQDARARDLLQVELHIGNGMLT